mmetsp:Transcript_12868/g.33337  ORF Transcript_12868/g.33337 Transcript_12868/m.33337 type:complete len:129 (-) Transcript_12868:110-496(-)|eukprot:CAMPEP_0197488448 /NCGR_PEP_ID=MMETSP1311-20131121/3389_1 /TAXON_ID=464262 /ORGANISM="Genus nov. species nov., Strain RCC856" /LENGTH=128 /DNA_ID=CAMNT_0043032483 /DNA_START=77 /DNA_END=463 /DNA_ORIENTATION=-
MEAKVEAPPARDGTEGDEEEVEDPGKTLARFEASVDMSNPQQVKVLEEMRALTARLNEARERKGWSEPSTYRNWNNYDGEFRPQVKKPREDDTYKAYLEHTAKQGGEPPALLEATAERDTPPLAIDRK